MQSPCASPPPPQTPPPHTRARGRYRPDHPRQVVFCGEVTSAGAHFAALGYVPPDPSINVADFMLDLVIKWV